MRLLADVPDPEVARHPVEREPPRVPEPVADQLPFGARARRRRGAGASPACSERSCARFSGSPAAAAVAHADVEEAVKAEGKLSPVVVGVRLPDVEQLREPRPAAVRSSEVAVLDDARVPVQYPCSRRRRARWTRTGDGRRPRGAPARRRPSTSESEMSRNGPVGALPPRGHGSGRPARRRTAGLPRPAPPAAKTGESRPAATRLRRPCRLQTRRPRCRSCGSAGVEVSARRSSAPARSSVVVTLGDAFARAPVHAAASASTTDAAASRSASAFRVRLRTVSRPSGSPNRYEAPARAGKSGSRARTVPLSAVKHLRAARAPSRSPARKAAWTRRFGPKAIGRTATPGLRRERPRSGREGDARPRRDEVLHRGVVVELEADPRLEAGSAAGALGERVAGGAVRAPDPRLVRRGRGGGRPAASRPGCEAGSTIRIDSSSRSSSSTRWSAGSGTWSYSKTIPRSSSRTRTRASDTSGIGLRDRHVDLGPRGREARQRLRHDARRRGRVRADPQNRRERRRARAGRTRPAPAAPGSPPRARRAATRPASAGRCAGFARGAGRPPPARASRAAGRPPTA